MSEKTVTYAYRENGSWKISAMTSRFKGIGGWHRLTDAQRAEHGWYPCFLVNEAFDPETQSRSSAPVKWEFDEEAKKVTATYALAEKSPETRRAEIEAGLSVTPRQARLMLIENDLLDLVEAAIENLPEPERKRAKAEWEYASEIRRDAPFLKHICAALELEPEDVDEMFRQATSL